MDEFIDQILSSSWGEMGGADRSSLDNSAGGPADCLSGPRVSITTNMPLSRENLEVQAQSNDVQNSSSNVIVGGNTSHALKRTLVNSQMQNHQDMQKPVILSRTACEAQNDSKTPVVGNIHGHESQESSHLTLQRHTECNTTGGSIALQLNTSGPVSPHGASPQGLPVGSAIKSAIAMPSSASGGTAGSDESGIHLCHADAYSPVSRQSLWSQSCIPGVSPVPRVLGQGKLKSIVLHREATEWEGLALGKRPREEEEMIEREKKCSTNVQGLDILHGTVLTNYIQAQVGQKPLMISGGTQSHQQMLQSGQGYSSHQHGNHSGISQPQSGATAGTIVNGVARPRVRARRGQATDPHSIAERLRRERIAERMKALQELVPNSNKTDKASMLDEIIEYVKFLQLQVKVLSMSRLGGAGAVAPLIADVSPEGAGGLMSTALGQAGGILPLSQEGVAFEQEVAKLMESNMTTAMQYLQNKGLCLMPIALATAISSSSGKPLLAAVPRKGVDSSERQKSDMESAVLPFGSSSTTMGLRAAPSGTDAASKENSIYNDIREEAETDKLNGVAMRQSDVVKAGSQNREEPTRQGQ